MTEHGSISLKSICSAVDYGLTASASSNVRGLKFLRITDIVSGFPDWATVPTVETEEGIAAKYRIDDGDIVIARTGASTGTARYIANPPDAVFASYLVRLKVRKELANARFIYYLLQTSEYQRYVESVSVGKSAQPNASAAALVAFTFDMPRLQEQEATAELLGTLDDKIAVNDCIVSTIERILSLKFDQIISDDCTELELGAVANLRYGKGLPKRDRLPGPVPVIGSGGVNGFHNDALVEGPAVIIGRKGSIGTVYWSGQRCYPIDTAFYVELTSPDISMEFAFHALRKLGLSRLGSDSAVPGLNRENALRQTIRIPGPEVLKNFTAEARQMNLLNDSRREENKLLADLRDTLLPRLMSGELRVKDAERIVEDVT